MKRLFILPVFFLLFHSSAQQYTVTYSGSGGYEMVERTNLRRYENGKYIGLTSREIHSYISPTTVENTKYKDEQWYDGSFYVWEDTRSNSVSTARGINKAVPSVFHISKNGKLTMETDNGYPSFRSFPSFTTQKLTLGSQWKAQAMRSVDPLNKNVFTKLPMEVLYTFKGEELYKNQTVYRINAMWQTNYGMSYHDYDGDKDLIKASGGHKADIIVLKDTGEAILISDNVDETFIYKNGSQINFKGTITLFTKFPPALQYDKLIPALNRIAAVKTNTQSQANDKKTVGSETTVSEKNNALKNNMVFEQTPAGLRLSVRNIRFVSDSDQVLPEEQGRLDEIAQVLRLAPESKFLIEGHTASVGKEQGEQVLSEKRSERIALELSKRGLKAENFICRGWGGKKPVVPNDSEENRAQNRRVEITILE